MKPFHLIGARDVFGNKVYVPLSKEQGRLFGNLENGLFTELSGDLESEKNTADVLFHLKAAASTGMPIHIFHGLEERVARDLNYLPTLHDQFMKKARLEEVETGMGELVI